MECLATIKDYHKGANSMKCDRCGENIPTGEETEHYGRILCEKCYFICRLYPHLSAATWTVQSAKNLSQMETPHAELAATQTKILQVIEETGGLTPPDLAERLQLRLPELEREIATLRHMEKIRGRMEAGRPIIILWDSQIG
jgi:hypothetical protein